MHEEMKSGFSEAYYDWVKQSELPPLTRTQWLWAEWLLNDNETPVIPHHVSEVKEGVYYERPFKVQYTNAKMMSMIGDPSKIFTSVRKYFRSYASKKEKYENSHTKN